MIHQPSKEAPKKEARRYESGEVKTLNDDLHYVLNVLQSHALSRSGAILERSIITVSQLVIALEKSRLVLSGEHMSKQALIDALELSLAALKKAEGLKP